MIDILTCLTRILAFGLLLAHLSFASTSPGAVADPAFVRMVARVDKELTTFSFKLAMLYFPVSPPCDHYCFCLHLRRPIGGPHDALNVFHAHSPCSGQRKCCLMHWNLQLELTA